MGEVSGWHRATIRELGGPTAVQTGPFGAELHAEDYVTTGVPLVLIRNIGDGVVSEDGLPLIKESDARRLSNYALEIGDVVFSRVGRVGSCFLVGERQAGWIISGQLLRMRIADQAIDKRFLIHQLLSEPVQSSMKDKSVGTTRQSINTSILEQLSICVPSRPEQERIAAILSTVDEAIRLTRNLVAKLVQIKRGMRQHLLTCGVGDDGRPRDPARHPELFSQSPAGLIPRAWEVARLGSLVDPR